MTLIAGKATNIIEANYLGEYRMELIFNDHHTVTMDFGPFLRNSFNLEIRKFLDPQVFITFRILHGNLIWGNYDLCFPIEDLYAGKILSNRPEALVSAVAETPPEYTVRPRKKSKKPSA